MRKRVCVVITARPSYSRIRSALYAIRARDDLDLSIVLAGSAVLDKYGNADQVIESDGFEVAARVHMVIEGASPKSMAKTAAVGLLELPTIFDMLEPAAVVTIADRFETIATSIAASYMNIPLVHIQGGEQTGSIDDKVRHANTMLADLHLVSTAAARERVVTMGKDPSTVRVTGCPSIDIAAAAAGSTLDFDPYDRYGGVGGSPDLRDGYVVVMQHPVTDEYSEARLQATQTLEAVGSVGLPVLWFWPNMDAGSDGTTKAIRSFRETRNSSQFHFFKNMTPSDFLKLLINSAVLVGNSSVGIRECSYLGVPVVNIGSRQRSRERGPNVLDVEHSADAVREAAEVQISQGPFERSELYGTGSAGVQIASEIAAGIGA